MLGAGATVRNNVSPVAIDENASGVDVTFADGTVSAFDLVVGADGLHSNVRRLMFGSSARGEVDLGYGVAAFELAGYHPRDELTYVSYNCPGKQVARFAMNGDRTLILLVFARDGAAGAGAEELRSGTDLGAPRRELHRLFDNAGWECAQIMEAMDTCESIYFDRVCQIHLDSWSADRCVLIGDAAACASLLAGQGSALAMMAAYVLAGELRRAKGDHRAACAAYEKRLRPFIEAKQKAAAQVASAFAPRTELGILFRNVVTKAMRFSFIADLAIGRSLKDDLVLPDYAA